MSYKYYQIPLSPSIASELILEAMNSSKKPMKRNELILYAEQQHANRGGIASQNITLTIKKALNNLCNDNQISNVSLGYYALMNMNSEINHSNETIEQINPAFVDKDVDNLIIEKEIGHGSEIVYLYFNPSDRDLAKHTNKDYWACKIGMTATTLSARIITQGIHTSMYRFPVIGLVIKTDDARSLEKAIHLALDSGSCRIDSSLGSEWFFTSPERIEEWYRLYQQINLSLCLGIVS